MSDETNDALPGGDETAISYPTADTSPMSVEDAARSLTDARHKAVAKLTAESAPEATAETELAQANADPETAPSEEPEAIEPEAIPPIEPPRSWTKAEKERFAALPRETQEYLHTREQERDRDVRRSQNEVAEERKAAKAEREAMEQLRKQYEAKLPALEKKLQTVGPFADIHSHEDLRNLQRNDPFRFQEYQLYVWEQQAEQVELQQAEARKATEKQRESFERKTREHALLIEAAPEWADADKLKAAQTAAAELFKAKGFNDEDMRAISDNPLLDDHRFQLIVADALKYQDIQKAPKAVASRPVPPVQRPGTAKPATAGAVSQIQALEKQLSSASGDRAARISAQIWALERKNQRA
jgi:hypothetical protein